MIGIVDELEFGLEEAENSLKNDLPSQFGAFSKLLIEGQGVMLAAMAHRLARRNSLRPGPELALYCVIKVLHHDELTAKLCSSPKLSYAQIFANEIRPMRIFQLMPVAQAFWSAKALQAEGPLRVFSETTFAKKNAIAQASMDLEQNLCEVAVVLCVCSDSKKVCGRVLTEK